MHYLSDYHWFIDNINATHKTLALPKWKKGQSGNPNGRPRKPEIDDLRKAIKIVEKRKRVKIFEKYVEMALTQPSVMNHLIGRLIPSLKTVDADI